MGAVVAAPAAEMVEMEVPMCRGAALVCLACFDTRLPFIPEDTKEPVEKQLGPHAVWVAQQVAQGEVAPLQ